MGRIVDLCAEIAEAAEEGEDGLVLPPEMWDRLREDWNDEDIDDALGLVRDSMLLGELAESADSLSARLVDILGGYADEASFRKVEAGEATISLDVVGQLARRVARLEDILAAYRDDGGPDHTGFDALQERLAGHGLEDMFEIPGLTKAGDENEDGGHGRQRRPPGAAPDRDDDDPDR
jgi:hypothetical protein